MGPMIINSEFTHESINKYGDEVNRITEAAERLPYPKLERGAKDGVYEHRNCYCENPQGGNQEG